MLSFIIISIAVFGGLGSLARRLYSHYAAQMPPKGFRSVPGPKGIPFIGVGTALSKYPQAPLREWAKEYGELVKFKMGFYNWVSINSPEAIKEIFEKQSAITSSRLPQPVASELVMGGNRLMLMHYGPLWRKLRSIVHHLLTPRMSDTFKPSQEFEVKQLMYDIMNKNTNQEDFFMHIRRYTFSILMTTTYGIRIPQWDCVEVEQVFGNMKLLAHVLRPGTFIADYYPPLLSLPKWMQPWRKRALKYNRRQVSSKMQYWNRLKEQNEKGQAPSCFVKQFMETDYQSQGISEIQGAFTSGMMLEAGSETTASALQCLVLHLAANPEAQARGAAEVSSIVGDSRPPAFSDEPSLPYVRACIKEILRLCPVTSSGICHRADADIFYKDYFIPSGTVLMVSLAVLHFDPERYPNPFAFRPERYLSKTAAANKDDPNERDHFDFGAGRRICPGIHLAENSLFITVASLLWAFEIRPPSGPDGKEEAMDTGKDAFDDGSHRAPKPFRARFVVRNEARRSLIGEQWGVAQKEGYIMRDVMVDSQGVVVGE